MTPQGREAEITPDDIAAAQKFWRFWGTPLFNALLDAAKQGRELGMTRTLAYRYWENSIVHLYTECPEGKLIGIARREAVATDDVTVMQGLEVCDWCREKSAADPQTAALTLA